MRPPAVTGLEDVLVPHPPLAAEPLVPTPGRLRRQLLHEEVTQLQDREAVINRLVYDVDTAPYPAAAAGSGERPARAPRHLVFESRFESGNLRQAYQMYEHVYDLVLAPDINAEGHTQWFFFSVTNARPGQPYRFNMMNLEKPNSQFNFGMQPLFYSTKAPAPAPVAEGADSGIVPTTVGRSICEGISAGDDELLRRGWRRAGSSICYYKNTQPRPSPGGKKAYHTQTFTLTFDVPGDVVYLAYHYPYTYTRLQTRLHAWQQRALGGPPCLLRQTLCTTLGGNRCDLLTVTDFGDLDGSGEGALPLDERPYIVLSGRVHPGESNASWVMDGARVPACLGRSPPPPPPPCTSTRLLLPSFTPPHTPSNTHIPAGLLSTLLGDSDEALKLRSRFVFKIIPMLNPDGVANGSHRCGLAGVDLNRSWSVMEPAPAPSASSSHMTCIHYSEKATFDVILYTTPALHFPISIGALSHYCGLRLLTLFGTAG